MRKIKHVLHVARFHERLIYFAENPHFITLEDGVAISSAVSFKGTSMMQASGGGSIPSAVKIRTEFPESWIYDNFDDVGLVLYTEILSRSSSVFLLAPEFLHHCTTFVFFFTFHKP
jgi:hypothetical protein